MRQFKYKYFNNQFKRRLSILLIFILMIQLMPIQKLTFAGDSTNDGSSGDGSSVSTTSGGAITVDLVEINLAHEDTLTGTMKNNDPVSEAPDPGEDNTTADEYVRTLDKVTYNLSYSVKEQNKQAENLVLKGYIEEPAGQSSSAVWDNGLLSYSGLTITDDGKTFSRDLGSISGGEAYTFNAEVYVPPTENGNTFKVHFEMSGDNTEKLTTTPVESIVSAIPKIDLILVKDSDVPVVNDDDSMDIIMNYGIAMASKAEMGMELLKQPIRFDINLDEIGVEGVRLKTKNGYGINNDGHLSYSLPYGKLKVNEEDESVSDSGQVTMTQSAPGQTIHVSVKNIDTSLEHFPSMSVGEDALDVTSKFFFAGYVRLLVDNENLKEGKNPITLKLENFIADGESGQSNYGDETEPLENNSHRHDLEKRDPGESGFGFRVDYVKDIHSTSKLDTMTSTTSGDGTVVPGQNFGATAYIINSHYQDLTEVSLILKIDPDVLELTDFVNGSNPPMKAKYHGGPGKENMVMLFGSKTFTDYDEMRNTTETDNGMWYSTYEEAAAVGPVSMIKIESKPGVELDYRETMTLALSLQAKTNPIGRILPIFASGKVKEVNGGDYEVGNYDPATNDGNSTGQRLFVSEINSRIEKTDITDGADVTGKSGQETSTYTIENDTTIEFKLQPSFTSDLRMGIVKTSEDVKIVDTLPEHLEYVEGSASVDPVSVQSLSTGETQVTWNMGKVTLNQSIEPITYSAVIPYYVKDNTVLTNKVVISSDADLSLESLRTDTYPVKVLNTRAWVIREEVRTPEVEINEPIEYEIEYANLNDKDMNNFDLITVLPNPQDGTNESDYDGGYEIKSIRVNHNETILATLEPSNQIEVDPKLNQPIWSVYKDLSEDEKKRVTGLRFQSAVFKKDEESRTITIELQPSNNLGGNTYASFVSGRTSDIDQLIRSKNVVAKTVSSTIGDTVWVDSNSNGLKEAHENGIANVQVTLMKGPEVVDNVATDPNGQYQFNNLHSGEYWIILDATTLPADYSQVYDPDGTQDHRTLVNLNRDTEYLVADFGYKDDNYVEPPETEKGQIGDYIYKDVDEDGKQSAGDTGLENIKVTLENTDTSETVEIRTDADGLYSFTGLEAGNYKVTVDTSTVTDLDLSIDPDATVDGLYTVTLAKDQVIDDADFGFKEKEDPDEEEEVDPEPPVVDNKGQIGDYIYKDVDEDGKQSADDTGLENIKVTLENTDTSETVETKTDADGLYSFTGLEAGNYKVTVDTSTVTDLDLSIDPDATVDGLYTVTLAKDQVIDDADFGFKEKEDPDEEEEVDPEPPVVDNKGQIGDYIYKDVDEDGKQSAGDTGLENIKVTLENTDTSETVETKTDADGLYSFTGLEAGNYKVTVDTSTVTDLDLSIDPDATVDGLYTVTLAKDQVVDDADFGFKEKEDPDEEEEVDPEPPVVDNKGQIGDYVFLDVNKNNVQDEGDKPLANVTLELTSPDQTKTETTTDQNGLYHFDKLSEGEYRVRVFASSLSIDHKLFVDPDGVQDGIFTVHLEKDQIVDYVDFGFIIETSDEKEDDEDDEKEKKNNDSDNDKDREKDRKKDKDKSNKNKTSDEETSDETDSSIVELDDKTIEELIASGKLKVYHVDKMTNELLTDVSSKTAPVGAQYSTLSKDFENYELVEEPSNKAGLIDEDLTTVTYYYEKTITIEDDDVPLGMIVLPKTGEESNLPYILVGAFMILLGILTAATKKKDEICKETKAGK